MMEDNSNRLLINITNLSFQENIKREPVTAISDQAVKIL